MSVNITGMKCLSIIKSCYASKWQNFKFEVQPQVFSTSTVKIQLTSDLWNSLPQTTAMFEWIKCLGRSPHCCQHDPGLCQVVPLCRVLFCFFVGKRVLMNWPMMARNYAENWWYHLHAWVGAVVYSFLLFHKVWTKGHTLRRLHIHTQGTGTHRSNAPWGHFVL